MKRDNKDSGGDLLDRIRREHLAADLWQLVRIPSPTRRERAVALAFAEMLETAGAEVEVDETLPDSPNVIGRGSADMKCGLAGILEIVRILKSTGCEFPGQILVTAYGLHEAPLGDSRGLLNLIEGKVLGEAAIVFEGFQDRAIVMGKGQSIWNVNLVREGEVGHELRREPSADNLLQMTNRVIERLTAKNASFVSEAHDYPLLGSQSLFVGQVHYGDFYNRVPSQAFIQGTWRWHPDRKFQDVQAELKALLAEVPCPENITIEDTWIFVGESFSFDPEERIVHALKSAYRQVTGKTMELAGSSGILDVNRLVPFGMIPAVSVSLDGESAHADYEYVRLERMEFGCRVALQTVLNYLKQGALR
jgi:acetylornithine deacetylase/succinyl-diaminopimelate desuccinylase-like protein